MATLNPDLSKPTCRVCLQNNVHGEMTSVFDLDADIYNLQIYEKIERCAGIKITQHDKMPTLICGECYGILKVSFKFRTICRNSNEYLNEVLGEENSTNKIKDVESNPLSVSVNSNKQQNKIKKYQTRPKEKFNSSSENITNEETSPNDIELKIEDFLEDNFLDDEDNDANHFSSSENIEVSTERSNFDAGEEEKDPKDNKKPLKRKKISNAKRKKSNNTPSKSLDISSDDATKTQKDKTGNKRERKEKQTHICDICGNKYKRLYGLELHMRRHLNIKPFECEICAYAFHSNIELIRHMRKHTGLKPYKCSYCPRAFGDHSTLIKHERLHRNERPFKCDTCGKSFTYSNVLKDHILTHTGEKPYICELCGKCFARPHHLRAHLETLQHQNDPKSKVLLQNIRRNNVSAPLKIERSAIKV